MFCEDNSVVADESINLPFLQYSKGHFLKKFRAPKVLLIFWFIPRAVREADNNNGRDPLPKKKKKQKKNIYRTALI